MNKELFKMLCANYGKEPNVDLHKLWNEELKDYDELYIEQAVKDILINDKFFPTLSRIIEEIKSLPLITITEEEKTKRMEERGIKPSWLGGKVVNEQIDTNTNNLFEEFNNFIEEFRNEEVF
ncbi:MAG: hypothetical protein J6S67_05885 [Methanobrevibacter sp.]|nr:hypothetical protein [Methanobrevibacter sp.]